ncbi:glycosyltransferase family 9 protein [Ekhidna sp.]|uniref:glycosyltransferase family 9 protein n=1 Tax=Ekhidna sp. TaxID=2608089 RepID=UPI0035179585
MKGTKQTLRNLKAEHFDLVIDLQNNLKAKRIKLHLNKKAYSVKKLNFKQWLFVNFKINLLPKSHVVDRFLDVIKPLGTSSDNLGLDFFIPERDEVDKDWLPETHAQGYAAVVLSARYKTRQLPTDRLIELCDRINKPIILIGGHEDVNTANEIEAFFKHGSAHEEKEIEELNKKAVIFNACGKFNFNQLASLIKSANWVFTHDNDMMHVAAAFKKQIYSIWGSTSPAFGEYPYRTKFVIFENNKLSCRPCSKRGFSKCPKGHFKCMNDLTFDFYLPD